MSDRKVTAPSAAPPQRNLKLLLEYDGSEFVGWERQKNGLGIQEVLETALFEITREPVTVEGSGRTDAGVHALGQVASVRITNRIHPEKLRLGLNAVMPPSVSVLSIDEVDPEFHARRSARSKFYRYSILNARSRRPLMRHTAFHFPQDLDVAAMQEAARMLEGTHDFRAFAREAWRRKTTVRTVLRSEILRDPPFLQFEIEGTGFLYNMVRIAAGTLLEVGQGRRRPDELAGLLEGREREEAGWTVPAHGLALVEVRY